MYRIVFFFLCSIALAMCAYRSDKTVLPYYNTPDFTPIFIENEDEVKSQITHTIGDFSFLDQDSVAITQDAFKDKIHVANFVFTSCGSICPTMTRHMKLISEEFRDQDNLVLLTYSVTPWIDTPRVLTAYRKKNKINNPNWHFLTGSKGEIYDLARQSYFAEEDIGYSRDSTEFLHTEHFILVDPSKRIRGIYNGTLALDMKQLIEDIHIIESEQ